MTVIEQLANEFVKRIRVWDNIGENDLEHAYVSGMKKMRELCAAMAEANWTEYEVTSPMEILKIGEGKYENNL